VPKFRLVGEILSVEPVPLTVCETPVDVLPLKLPSPA
jgi:hypothetical protein